MTLAGLKEWTADIPEDAEVRLNGENLVFHDRAKRQTWLVPANARKGVLVRKGTG